MRDSKRGENFENQLIVDCYEKCQLGPVLYQIPSQTYIVYVEW